MFTATATPINLEKENLFSAPVRNKLHNTPSNAAGKSTKKSEATVTRKAFGDITNTSKTANAPPRKALGDISNKNPTVVQPSVKPPQVTAKVVKKSAKKLVAKPSVEVESMHNTKFKPNRTLSTYIPGLDFDVNQFFTPMINFPLSDSSYGEDKLDVIPFEVPYDADCEPVFVPNDVIDFSEADIPICLPGDDDGSISLLI
eukprot:TRINITY_DN2116_c0_g1_i1.p1 TRINITY_DN2116_c0_g1~~TRINITY_DN2116_c0_g1_i1.p1  ORF type:complete len:201 (-),score=57.14 TRINITY_DN2116_c0_g1_i1:138-740(-)